MSYVTYLEDLPKLDETFFKEACYSRDNYPNIFKLPNHPYQLFNATEKLKNFIELFLSFDNVEVYSVNNTLPIHTDFNRARAYNYIFDTGGPNVLTSFYDINDFTRNSDGRLEVYNEDYKPIESVCIRSNVWHILDVTVPHGVSNIKSARLAVTVSSSLLLFAVAVSSGLLL
jgi:hypothetical protein